MKTLEDYGEMYMDLLCIVGIDPQQEFYNIVREEEPGLFTEFDPQLIDTTMRNTESFKRQWIDRTGL